jgi:acetoin utilization deacetylase AcuC-like enzyme
MRVFYTPRYYADIGDGHIFPIRKFELVRDRLLGEGTLRPEDLIEPEPASVEDVCLVHMEDYVSRLCAGTLKGIHCNTIRTAKKIFESQEEVFSRGMSRTEGR